MYQRKKQNKRGSITYGSGSRKKNRGSGNTGGVGKAGIWDHKKGCQKYYANLKKHKRVILRRKIKRKTFIVPNYLVSQKYRLRLEKKKCFVNPSTKEIILGLACKLSYSEAFLKRLGYTITINKL